MNLELLQDLDPIDWPVEAQRVILDTLCDPDADDDELILAADLAGNGTVVDDEVAQALSTLVADRAAADEVRAQAALALGPALQEFDEDGEWEFGDDAALSGDTFGHVTALLRQVFSDPSEPDDVRRRVLEASVRAPQDWHREAIAEAYAQRDDHAWQLTAVFCMRWVPGFDAQILEALESDSDQIRYEALLAAGAWELYAAWPHVEGLLRAEDADKSLRLAAIEAAVGMPTDEAGVIFAELVDHHDDEIAAAATDAMMMSEAMGGYEELDEDEL